MEIGGYGYEKPELLRIIEEIYDCKSKKRDLELKLSSAKFHQSYLPQRREIAGTSATTHMFVIFPLTMIIVAAVCFIVYYIQNAGDLRGDVGAGFILLCSMLVIPFVGYADEVLIQREIGYLALLYADKNSARAKAFCQKHDIITLQRDEEKTKQQIGMLTEQIAAIEQKIADLTKQQENLLKEKEEREETLRNKGILFDENPNKPVSEGKFALKDDGMGTLDARDLYEFYLKEEQYMRNTRLQLEAKLQQMDKEIAAVDDDFEAVKKNIIFFLVIYILVAIVQSAFTGVLRGATSIICIIASVSYIFYFEGKCKRPVLLYLVEHDSKFVKEYAFRNECVPIKHKKEELLLMMKQNEEELEDIKKRKESIVF